MKETVARFWMGATALGSLCGLIISLTLAWQASDAAQLAYIGGEAPVEAFTHRWVRIMTVFSYFTIQSNVIVIITTGLLAISFRRTSEVFRIFRLIGLVAITITGIVYNGYLAFLVDPHGWSLVSTDSLHVYTPAMAAVGWLIFGPRPGFRISRAWWMVAYGVAWIIYTEIRGAVLGWYPYPFVNAEWLGYPLVIGICVVLLAIGFGMASLIMWIDQHLPDSAPPPDDAPDQTEPAPAAAGP